MIEQEMIGQGMIGQGMIGRGNLILLPQWRHPERSRSSGGARDLAGSPASLKSHIAPAGSRFTT